MNPRVIAEVSVTLAIVGLALELAGGHTWVVVSAGVAAAIWLCARASP